LGKSAGKEGFDFVPAAGGNSVGRYEIASLCLGMMHFHFGHPKLALEVNSLNILILIHAPCFYIS
jgi:anaphase-promoting complex subunit 5